MKKIILPIFLLLILSALSAEFDLTDANKFYQNQEYEKAKESYEYLIKKGIKNFTLFYNLGNTYFKLERYGLARLYYEKAAKINPRDKDLLFNLTLLKTKFKDKEETKESFIINALRNSYYFFSLNMLAISELIFFILIMLAIAGLILSESRTFRKILKFLLITFSVFLFVLLTITIMRLQEYNSQKAAVIISETVFAYSGPSKDFQEVFTIHEGLKVKIEKFEENWVLIKLQSGSGGWIQKKSIAAI